MIIHNCSVDGFTCFKLYIALKLHFTTANYDFIKYKGKTTTKYSAYEKRHDKAFFERLAKKYTLKQLKEIFISYLLHSSTFYVGDAMNEEQCIKIWKAHKAVTRTFCYYFERDLHKIMQVMRHTDNFKNVFMCDNQLPKLFNMCQSKDISIETVLVLDMIFKFLPKWKELDDVVLNDFILKVEKYSKFVKNLNLEKYYYSIKKVLSEYKNCDRVY